MVIFKPEMIILHHSLTADSGTVSWNAIRKYHTENLGWSDNGYHWGLEKIGEHYEILAGRMMNEKGAHTRGHNNQTLGICFVGNYDEHEVPEEQWTLGIRFVASLCEVLNIETAHIYGHHDFADYKSCPGNKFSLIDFKTEVRSLMLKDEV